MKFIKDLIKNKNWSDAPQDSEFSADNLRREFAEDGIFESPLVGRQTQQAMDFDDDDDDWMDDESDAEFDVAERPEEPVQAEPQPREPSVDLSERFLASLNDPANDVEEAMEASDDFDDANFEEDDDDLEENVDWNIGLETEEQLADANDFQFEPDFDDSADMEVFEDPLFQDESSAREIEQAAMDAVREQQDLSEREKEALLEEIRRAMHAVRHIRSDEEIGRQNAARDQLGRVADAAAGNRILNETNEIMEEDDGSRRRQAIALMKAAAHATKSDPNLKKLAGRNSALNEDEQSDYRQDLQSFPQTRLYPSRPRSEGEALEKAAKPAPLDFVEEPEPDTETRRSSKDRKAVGLNDLPVLDRPAKVHSEILRHKKAISERSDNPNPSTDDLRSALQAARKAKTVELDAPSQEAPARNIWDIERKEDESTEDAASMEPDEQPAKAAPIVQVPQPSQGRAGRQVGRVKTRLLGFQHEDETEDPFSKEKSAASHGGIEFPVGWLVVIDGPGRGKSFALGNGVTQIGRGEGQAVRLDFGDLAISRENHAAIAYDDEKNSFFLGHGGKSNLVRLNGSPVLSTENLSSADTIRIGETTLRFVAFCDEGFGWTGKENGNDAQRAFG